MHNPWENGDDFVCFLADIPCFTGFAFEWHFYKKNQAACIRFTHYSAYNMTFTVCRWFQLEYYDTGK